VRQVGDTIYLRAYPESENWVIRQKLQCKIQV